MKRIMQIAAFLIALPLIAVPKVGAVDITIYDLVSSSPTGWYAQQENDEVEPGCLTGQAWDLEKFDLTGSSLTMVGGFDFANGYQGWTSGDIFLDINGDANYGPDNTGTGGGNSIVANTFGYDYVIDLDFSSGTYDVYSINGASTVKVFYNQNDESNPWQYASGGQSVWNDVAFGYWYYDDLEGRHYFVNVSLAFLAHGTNFTSHFTYQCGNDNLMGNGTKVPEPSTILLLGMGLLGGAIVVSRRRKKA